MRDLRSKLTESRPFPSGLSRVAKHTREMRRKASTSWWESVRVTPQHINQHAADKIRDGKQAVVTRHTGRDQLDRGCGIRSAEDFLPPNESDYRNAPLLPA